MKILETGGCGHIGSNLANLLVKEKHKVAVFDRNVKDFSCSLDAWVIQGDCRHQASVLRAIKELQIDTVVHLASIAVATECDKNPDDTMDNNLNSLRSVLMASKIGKVKRFVFISSSFVYGDFQYFPADEIHRTEPRGIYGATKLAGEYLTKCFCDRYGIDWTIIRPSAVYGYGDKNHRVVQVLLENAVKGETLKLEGADQVIDFTYVEDTVQGISKAIQSENAIGQIFNITRGEGRTLRELGQIINNLVPCKIEESVVDGFRPKRGALDILKARDLLGYKPKWKLEDGVKEYYKRMVSNG
jgi:nucleoside-diphosphate-sugar epimerase